MTAEAHAFIATSLDGFIAREDGGIDWLDDLPEIEDHGFFDFLAGIDALVMGRKTFEQVLGFGEWPYGDRRLIVLSRSRTSMEVPPHVLSPVEFFGGTPAELIGRESDAGTKRLYVDGGRVIQSFLRDGLLDEITLTRLPVLLGQGIPLFGPLEADRWLDHVSTRSFPSGLVQSVYRRRLGKN